MITIISGSNRKNSESGKVARFIASILENQLKKSCSIIDLAETELPLWDQEVWSGSDKWQRIWNPIAEQLQKSTAIIAVCPEWAGMATPHLKNFFLFCSNKELAHKPGLIVAVSASVNGAYPVAELHLSSTKNNRLVWIPEHVIVRNVADVFNLTYEEELKSNKQITERLDYSLRILSLYEESFKHIRESEINDYVKFPFGM